MIDPSQLLKDLQSLVRELETDLLERSVELPDITARLKEEYTQANEAKRTALSYEEWRSDYITPKDKALNQAYRQRYSACHRKYSLAVPFMERIFESVKDKF